MNLIESFHLKEDRLLDNYILDELDYDHIRGFNKRVKHILMVPTGDSGIATKSKPILFTSALAQCIALYVYSNNGPFSYLYHIYTKGLFKTISSIGNETKFNYELGYLSSLILNDITLCRDSFSLGLVYGRKQETALDGNVRIIEDSVYKLCNTLGQEGVTLNRNSNRISRGVIIDYKEPRIVLDSTRRLRK